MIGSGVKKSGKLRVRLRRLLTAVLVFAISSAMADENRTGRGSRSAALIADLTTDQRHFYSHDRLFRFGLVFGGGAIMANTPMDQRIQDYYQERIRNAGTDAFSSIAKPFGEGAYLIPISAALASLSVIDADSWLGEYGWRTARTFLVGSMPLLIMQQMTGAGRPGEYRRGSRWRPLADSNGVGGHAFMGAVPFLVLAEMSERPLVKYAAYVASAATALSRINDEDHYFSQQVLGWHIAYEATRAVFATQADRRIGIAPTVRDGHFGIMASAVW